MRPSLAESPGADLLRWMDPLASDMISAGYAQMIADEGARAPIVRCHALMWRGVLTGRDDIGTFRRELSRLASLAGLGEANIEIVNRQVLAELLDTVAARYTRSPREASRLSFEVARAACRIAVERPAASPRRAEKSSGGGLQLLALAKRGA